MLGRILNEEALPRRPFLSRYVIYLWFTLSVLHKNSSKKFVISAMLFVVSFQTGAVLHRRSLSGTAPPGTDAPPERAPAPEHAGAAAGAGAHAGAAEQPAS